MRDIIKPTAVLILICAFISGLLALTYNLTGVAELGSGYTSDELATFSAVALPQADELEAVTVSATDEDLLFAYRAKNGAGAALILNSKGYSSDGIVMMIGMDPDGVIQGIKIISHTETPGIGDRVAVDGSELITNLTGTDGMQEVDAIANATKTSNGLINGAKRAAELFAALKGELLQ